MYIGKSIEYAAKNASPVKVTLSGGEEIRGIIQSYNDDTVIVFDTDSDTHRFVNRSEVSRWFFDWSHSHLS